MNSKGITLVIADTKFHRLSNRAIERALAIVDAKDVLIFSDRPGWVAGAKYINIPVFNNKDDYNDFVVRDLVSFVETSHCMIIQYDGFPLDRSRWFDGFLEFDYIGAPWPNYPFHNVGNGGFSIRSRRLLEATFGLAHLRCHEEPEDLFIGRTLRPLLERRFGVGFPTDKQALSFSFESPGHPKVAFGFHGVLNLLIAYRNELSNFFDLAPPSLLLDRRAELLFGARFLPESERNLATGMLMGISGGGGYEDI